MKGAGGADPGEPRPDVLPADEAAEATGSRDGTVREEGDPGAAQICELCGGPVLNRHCKVVCLNCGFQRDCSDP